MQSGIAFALWIDSAFSFLAPFAIIITYALFRAQKYALTRMQ